MSNKTVNYSDEAVEALRAGYNPDASADERAAQVAALAENLGRSTRSIVAKLTSLGLYIKPEYVGKNGSAPESKAEIVARIAPMIGLNEEQAESLEKANKNVLHAIERALTK